MTVNVWKFEGQQKPKTNLKIYKATRGLLFHTKANPMMCAWTDFDSSSDAVSVMQSLIHTYTHTQLNVPHDTHQLYAIRRYRLLQTVGQKATVALLLSGH